MGTGWVRPKRKLDPAVMSITFGVFVARPSNTLCHGFGQAGTNDSWREEIRARMQPYQLAPGRPSSKRQAQIRQPYWGTAILTIGAEVGWGLPPWGSTVTITVFTPCISGIAAVA